MDYSLYLGKYLYVEQAGYPVWLFDVVSYDPKTKQVTSKQVVESQDNDSIEVYCGPEWDVYPKNDILVSVFDTPEELFDTMVTYLRDQIENVSGLAINR